MSEADAPARYRQEHWDDLWLALNRIASMADGHMHSAARTEDGAIIAMVVIRNYALQALKDMPEAPPAVPLAVSVEQVEIPPELDDAACDAALRATAVHLDVRGSALTVNREKMRARFRALVAHFRKAAEIVRAG